MAQFIIRSKILNPTLQDLQNTMNWLIDAQNNIVTTIQSAYSEIDYGLHITMIVSTFADVITKISVLQTQFQSNFSFTFEYS